MTIPDILDVYSLSQTELANRFGIPLRTVQNWAEGTRKPSEWVENLINTVLRQEKEIKAMKSDRIIEHE